MFTLLCIMSMSTCSIGIVLLLKSRDVICYNANNIDYNVGSMEICGNEWYRGTLNGKHWKTKDMSVVETITASIGSNEIVDVDDILNKSVTAATLRGRSIQNVVNDYDKLLKQIQEI